MLWTWRQALTLIALSLAWRELSFTYNDWFCQTMVRHQLLQLPSMIGLGMLLGAIVLHFRLRSIPWVVAALIFCLSSLAFWMIPRSIDLAVITFSINWAMHLNMLIVGVIIVSVWRNAVLEVKVTFLGMLSAMLMAVGFSLRSFELLLCSSFTIEQQQETGLYLAALGGLLFWAAAVTFFRGLASALPLCSKTS